jgi:ribosomal protein S12 methylthiotransferase
VLKAMRRGGDGASYLKLLDRVRHGVPGLAVRTTFIVGFPNETERRFEELLRFVEAAQLDHVGAFSYSHEEGTAAGKRRNRVPEAVKQQRLETLMKLQEGISRSKLQGLVGTRQWVMIDGPAPGGVAGRLATQALEVDGQVLVEGTAAPGTLLEVLVTGADAHDLLACPVAA